jgi:hypothetical protein
MGPLSDIFPLTRVVNLPARNDRYREITAQLQMLKMPFAPGKVELFPAICPTEPAGFPSIGSRGCFLSHLEILRDARARGVASVLMIEDDLEVSPRDVEALSGIAVQLTGQTWHLAYLGHVEPTPPAEHPGWMAYTGDLRTSHFYAAHASIFDRLIAYLEACLVRPPGDPVGGPMEYDGALNMFRRWNPDVVVLLAQPSLGGQRSSRSDIHPRTLDRLPGVRTMLPALRRAKRALLG